MPTATTTDYYKLLDVSPTADQNQVKKAYHKLAKRLHPDKNQGDPTTEERFKAVKEAYEHLIDPGKRVLYDAERRQQQQEKQPFSSSFTSTFTSPKTNTDTGAKKSESKPSHRFTFFSTSTPDDEGEENTRSGWNRYRFSSFNNNDDIPFNFDSWHDTSSYNNSSSKRPPPKATPRRRKTFSERPPWNNEFAYPDFDDPDVDANSSFRSTAWNLGGGGLFGPGTFFDTSEPFFDPKPTYSEMFADFFGTGKSSKLGDASFFTDWASFTQNGWPGEGAAGGLRGAAKGARFKKAGLGAESGKGMPNFFQYSSNNNSNLANDEEDELPTDKKYKSNLYKNTFKKKNNEDAVVSCKHCQTPMQIEQLIFHERNCPLRPPSRTFTDEDLLGQDGDDFRSWAGRDWRDVHSETQEAIRRDRERAKSRAGVSENPDDWDEETFGESWETIRCPYCQRSFNRRAGARHMPFCPRRPKTGGIHRSQPPPHHHPSFPSEANLGHEDDLRAVMDLLNVLLYEKFGGKSSARSNTGSADAKKPKSKASTPRSPLNPSPNSSKPFHWSEPPEEEEGPGLGLHNPHRKSAMDSRTEAEDSHLPDIGASIPTKFKSPHTQFAGMSTSRRSASGFKPAQSKINLNLRDKSSSSNLGPGCSSCQKIYGKNRAPFVCSCGAKKGL